MAQLTTIPDCVTNVTVKDLLSISQLGFADQCLLRVAFGASVNPIQRLPDHPSATLGSILHRLLDQASKGRIPRSGSPCKDAETALNALLLECDTDVASALSPAEWSSRRSSAIGLAAKRLEGQTQTTRFRSSRTRLGFHELPRNGIWGEVSIKSSELRLSGQIDLVEKRDPVVMITDTKTGRIEDRNGEILKHIETQLRLYGLAAIEHLESWRIELSVERERKWGISFELPDETETRQWLVEKLAQLPANMPIPASSIACVGEACRTCPYRHICPTYREAAPIAWKDGAIDGPLPEDIWGRIERIRESNGKCDVDILDQAKRRVRVTGISQKWKLSEQAVEGMTVYFFGLAADKPQFHRGVWKHHLNFHEIPSSRRSRPAASLAVFRSN